MKKSYICLALCGFALHFNSDNLIGSENTRTGDIVVKATSEEVDGVKTETKKYYRNGQCVMTFQTIVRPDNTVSANIYLGIDRVMASIPVVEGKMGRILVEPGSFAVAIEDKNRDGEFDSIEILDDDMNLLEAYRKVPGRDLLPLETRKLNEIIAERKKAFEKMMNRAKEKE
jgi:predicted RNA-binding protein